VKPPEEGGRNPQGVSPAAENSRWEAWLPVWSPRQLRPVYFGESEDLRKRVCDLHEKHSDWKREAGILDLFYAYHPTLSYTAQQRKDAEWALIQKCDTPCNIQLRSFSGLQSLYRPLGGQITPRG
jgi:hypothetical protein